MKFIIRFSTVLELDSMNKFVYFLEIRMKTYVIKLRQSQLKVEDDLRLNLIEFGVCVCVCLHVWKLH